jgi:hypothetical protein
MSQRTQQGSLDPKDRLKKPSVPTSGHAMAQAFIGISMQRPVFDAKPGQAMWNFW